MSPKSNQTPESQGGIEFATPIAATSTNLSVNTLQEMFAARTLKLRPAFQRNLVWNNEQQSFLIDTVLRGLPVPEVYIQQSTSEEGADENTVVVDGQQRITALLKFLNGHLLLVGDNDELDSRWRNKKFADLDNTLKRRFRRFQLVARQLPDLEEAVLREVFRRLNKTVEPLEPQELRHAAYTGPLLNLMEKAASHPALAEIGVFSPKDYLRRRNDEFVAEVAFAVTSKAYPNKKDGLDEFFLTREKHGMPADELQDLERRFGRVFAELGEATVPIRRTRFRNKSDFYTLMVSLTNHAEQIPLPDDLHDEFLTRLTQFSARVNEIKRKEGVGGDIKDLISDDIGTQAVKYLRAVERAASDRLSRVRREEALRTILEPIFGRAPSTPLDSRDAEWTWIEETADDPADEILGPLELEAERERTQKVLLESKTEFDALLEEARSAEAEEGKSDE